MYYVRTADRLQRTAPWVEDARGRARGHRASVVIEDSLGIGADLDAAMAAHVDGYVDEWAATLADPEKLRAVRVVRQRPGRRPDAGVGGAIDNGSRHRSIAGPTLEVRR